MTFGRGSLRREGTRPVSRWGTGRGRCVRVALLLALFGCVGANDAPGDGTSVVTSTHAAAQHGARVSAASPPMDSALVGALDRFREGLPRTDTLRYALPSKDAVVRQLIALVERRDTVALARLHLSRSEWAWLVYPESRYTHAPYRQAADIGWMLIVERSNSALARVLDRRGGRRMQLVAWTCDAAPEPEGRTLYWGHCTVSYRNPDGVLVTERLFSSIVERDGRFKIGSYSNQF